MGIWSDRGNGNGGKGGDFKDVPPGRYLVIVTRWEDGESKKGTSFVKVVMKVLAPAAQKGCYIVERFFTNQRSLWKWDMLAEAVGYKGAAFNLTARSPEMGAFLQTAPFVVTMKQEGQYINLDKAEAAKNDAVQACREELEAARRNTAGKANSSGGGGRNETPREDPLTIPDQYRDGGEFASDMGQGQQDNTPQDDDGLPPF